MMKKNLKILYTTSLALLVTGCAGTSFTNQIQNDKYDLLAEESFMRYNTNRLAGLESTNKNFISLALIACHQDKISKGLSLLEASMHENKSNPFYWNAVGTCYTLSKDLTKGIFYYELGLEAARESNKALSESNRKTAESVITNNLGLIHLKFKRFDDAFDSFKKSNLLTPNYFTPQFNTAQLFIEFNENNKALTILKNLETKNSADIDLLYSLALIYYRKNDYDTSFSYVSKIQADYLNRADIVGIYAFNLMKKNKLVEAKAILEKRLYANEYNRRNELILEEVNQKIKDLPKEEQNKQIEVK
ncbi:MAG: hypothetical protein HOP07_06235 [Bacteriovoracaceae bacterium]|nr:hypothetical protein [Bacteriovoracaceae bacterium]